MKNLEAIADVRAGKNPSCQRGVVGIRPGRRDRSTTSGYRFWRKTGGCPEYERRLDNPSRLNLRETRS